MWGFSDIVGFLNVIGVIDGIYIRIKLLFFDEYLYVNRKNYYFINVQVVCDLKFRFMNIVVKWLGSIYDFFILENSVLKDMFERGIIFEGWFFGGQWLFFVVLVVYFSVEFNNQIGGEI